MPKQSLKKRRKVSLTCYTGQFSGCCGIGILQDFGWYLTTNIVSTMESDQIYMKEMKPLLRLETNKVLRRYPCVYATVTDECEGGAKQIKAMKQIGWKEEHITKSKHGNYMIHVLSKKR